MLRQLALKQLTRAVVKGSAPSTAAKYSLPIAQTRFINNLADEKLTIPTDKEQQGGRRKEEIDAEAVGKVAFNRDPIIPADERGTKEHPILVPSGESCRVVGFEDPMTHQLVWFNLNKGALHYVPDIGLYFKLSPIE